MGQAAASPAPVKSAKLPKLVIIKFSGELTDWPRFWNQFEAEIDRTEVAAVTKFSYLKELVDPKVKTTIDGLPFTTEGYQRAKNILKSKYGQMSDIVNASVQNIMALPVQRALSQQSEGFSVKWPRYTIHWGLCRQPHWVANSSTVISVMPN